jgi:hypothetical protein
MGHGTLLRDVGHSHTCDVSALRLCLFPLELMNGREIATQNGDTHVDLRLVNGASLQHPASIDFSCYGALQICIDLQSLRFSVAVCEVQIGASA